MASFDKTNNVITCTGEIFIIPNSSSLIDAFMSSYQDTLKNYFDKIAELNGYRKFDPASDYIAQFWWASQEDFDRYDPNDPNTSPEDPENSNLARHGFSFKDEEGVRWYGQIDEEYLPKYFFDNAKEGQVINMKYPVLVGTTEGEKREAVLDMSLRPAQTEFRYSRYGNFHELLVKV